MNSTLEKHRSVANKHSRAILARGGTIRGIPPALMAGLCALERAKAA